MKMIISILAAVIGNFFVLGVLVLFFYIYSKKKTPTIEEDTQESSLEDIFEHFSNSIVQGLTKELNLQKLQTDMSEAITNNLKQEISLLLTNKEILEQVDKFFQTSIQQVLQEQLPEVIPVVLQEIFSASQPSAEEGEANVPAQMDFSQMNLKDVDLNDLLKLFAFQIGSNFLQKQNFGAMGSSVTKQVSSTSISSEKW